MFRDLAQKELLASCPKYFFKFYFKNGFGHDPESSFLGTIPKKILNQNVSGSCPNRTFRIVPKVIFILFLKMTLGMIPKVLFGHDPETFFRLIEKSFGIVPKKNFEIMLKVIFKILFKVISGLIPSKHL